MAQVFLLDFNVFKENHVSEFLSLFHDYTENDTGNNGRGARGRCGR